MGPGFAKQRLAEADLTNANLYEADLTNAILYGVNEPDSSSIAEAINDGALCVANFRD